jgi:hypothetical protein
MMLDAFEYRLQARRPGTYLALGAGLFTACALVLTGATGWAWLPVLAYLALVLAQLWQNRSGGLRLSAARLEWFRDDCLQDMVPLARIARARVRSGVFAPDECTLVLRDGRRIELPYEALPPARRLQRELAARGVPLG